MFCGEDRKWQTGALHRLGVAAISLILSYSELCVGRRITTMVVVVHSGGSTVLGYGKALRITSFQSYESPQVCVSMHPLPYRSFVKHSKHALIFGGFHFVRPHQFLRWLRTGGWMVTVCYMIGSDGVARQRYGVVRARDVAG